ncbi:hypothetical protein [Enterococcus dongliensis]|uniref:Phage protein n=1 Tax=Enterococcus dongliensis TaxID=2559925 RepID=A0ABU3EL82_9ENTE|nr:hypothetical protein [Enterococcus dongliensis]MDT2595613.1 hypothetical protein [Enterococcus dongliensis]MDT2646424.1 hypothetical protein [Enterococcus dongliensis]MDT2669595.1 hypothetical protein [Enterococcus dongliensis]
MPKKKIREIAAKYGYQRLRNYRQWDNVHFSAEVSGIVIVVNISSGELFERNPFTKRLVKKQEVKNGITKTDL